jgi:hypothetical protein
MPTLPIEIVKYTIGLERSIDVTAAVKLDRATFSLFPDIARRESGQFYWDAALNKADDRWVTVDSIGITQSFNDRNNRQNEVQNH